MKLSRNKLFILGDKLLEIISSPDFGKEEDFICEPEFEDMLCLATDIDRSSANDIYQKIYKDIDNTMGLPRLADVVAKHLSDL